MGNIKVKYKDKDVIIIEKPAGMPSQSDPTGDIDALRVTSEMLASAKENSDLWLVHRLDRTVGGLIAFARNKKSAAELSGIVAAGKMEKTYLAVCHGRPEEGELSDFLFKDSATSKAYVANTERRGAKRATLINKILSELDGMSLCQIELLTGRFHQIRAQLSSRKNPLVGDKKYGSKDSMRRQPALFAHKLSFILFGKEISAVSYPDKSEYPWNKFEEFLKND